MKCVLDFDEKKTLCEQEINAWGIMQSLKEEPGYKESEIENEYDKEFFKGYKFAVDAVCNILDNLEFDGTITEEQNDEIQLHMQGDICELLYSILENQDFEEDEE